MTVSRTQGGPRRGGVLWDLVPSALVVMVAAGLDGAVFQFQRTLAPGGALPDAALATSAVGVLAVLGLPGAVRRSRVRRAGIREVDAMTGDEFEERLAVLFRAMGYDVRHTGRRGDFGADLVVERGEERAVVQAKRYHGAVGIEAVQQAVGAARYYDATDATVVTNSVCTPAARSLATANGVELIERDSLVGLLAAYPVGGAGTAALGALAVQVLGGVRLCVFAVGALARLAWWLARRLARMARAALRGAG